MPVSPKRIAILFHKGDRHRDVSCYAIHHFRELWEEDGHEVVYLFGTKRFVPADIVIVHVNLSVVPDAYIGLARRYPKALNINVRDIRKSSFATAIVRPGDDWAGPVIVKSDLNYAGEPERVLRRTWPERRWRTARRARRLLDKIGGRTMPFAESVDYQVFDSMASVPDKILKNRCVVVEKFRPEIEHGLYHTTIYQFLGDRWTCTRLRSPKHVVNAAASVFAEDAEPHEDMVAWRKRLGLDYGKLDYVVVDGEAILLDVNKTTGIGVYLSDEKHRELRRKRAEGLYSYFDR